ncbi:NUDIX domain-containing protein [Lacticaseibacillus baoqingensis]|uniref:NAD(+) diphosphatase n=1 Tax=Lacticaseibacillus baoqingensis TaxID=2486013 RepID=A0ABW4ECL1_9LACO|nr:NUDIX domain-containing protein [Lacticaseibacillus baoqingensis]
MFTYCPTCGTKLVPKAAGDDGEIPYCNQCERFWFPNFADCVIILVANAKHEIVLAKMPYLSERYESLISGYIKPGENVEQAATREVHEELGVSVDQLDYAGTYWLPQHQMMMHGYIALTTDQKLHLSDELGTASWVPVAAAPARMWPPSPENSALDIIQLYQANY